MTEALWTIAALQSAVFRLGFELVDARVSGGSAARVVSLRIDRIGGAKKGEGVTTADCAVVTRGLEAVLDQGGAVRGSWRLEVSSPGIERPIRFPEHWRRYVGHEVRLRATGIRGRQVMRIIGVPDDARVELEWEGTRHVVPLEAVREATLVVDWSVVG